MRIIAIKKRSIRTSVEKFIGNLDGDLNAEYHAERRGKGGGRIRRWAVKGTTYSDLISPFSADDEGLKGGGVSML